ncbi:MAG: hypothetical protein Q8898_04675 [Bacillota bacterium]|nr:hypothetical protein [Bacillota bacterium]
MSWAGTIVWLGYKTVRKRYLGGFFKNEGSLLNRKNAPENRRFDLLSASRCAERFI